MSEETLLPIDRLIPPPPGNFYLVSAPEWRPGISDFVEYVDGVWRYRDGTPLPYKPTHWRPNRRPYSRSDVREIEHNIWLRKAVELVDTRPSPIA